MNDFYGQFYNYKVVAQWICVNRSFVEGDQCYQKNRFFSPLFFKNVPTIFFGEIKVSNLIKRTIRASIWIRDWKSTWKKDSCAIWITITKLWSIWVIIALFFPRLSDQIAWAKNVYLFWKCIVYRSFEAKNKWIKTKKNTFTWLATSVHLTPNICGFASKMFISLINSNDAPVMLYQAMASSQTKLFLVKFARYLHTYIFWCFPRSHRAYIMYHFHHQNTNLIQLTTELQKCNKIATSMKTMMFIIYKITSRMMIRCLNQVYKWNIHALKMSSLHPLDYHLFDIHLYIFHICYEWLINQWSLVYSLFKCTTSKLVKKLFFVGSIVCGQF